MKKRWKQLSKLQRKMIIYIGLLNAVVLAFQFVGGFWFSWWMAGIGTGVYICFLLDCFGFFSLGRSPALCPAQNCMNFNCLHYDKERLACEFSEVPGNE